MTDDTIPTAGRKMMYTSGWPKIQNKCWYSSVSPPNFGWKKRKSNFRSSSCMMFAAESAGSAKITENDVATIAQQKSGSRLSDIPGARNLKIVTMKLTAPTVVEMVRKSSPSE